MTNAIQTGQEIWKIPVEINVGRCGKYTCPSVGGD